MLYTFDLDAVFNNKLKCVSIFYTFSNVHVNELYKVVNTRTRES